MVGCGGGGRLPTHGDLQTVSWELGHSWYVGGIRGGGRCGRGRHRGVVRVVVGARLDVDDEAGGCGG